MEVRDLLLSPPRDQPYETLKRELTNCTSPSEQRRLQQLLTAEELGDRKPNQVLRRIQQLLGDKATTMDESFMREQFLQLLPTNVRMVITPSAAALNLEALAQLADRIVETSPTTTIAATNTPDQLLTAQVSELTRRLEDLSTQMAKVVNSFRRSRSRSPARRRRLPPLTLVDSTAVADHLCWYHQKFGDDEKKCQPPCQKSGNVLASRSTSNPGLPTSHLLFLTDANSGRRFLIDTGAEVSVIPPSPTDQKIKQDCAGLRAVNGSAIATFGTWSLTLGLRRVFRWIFVIADTSTAIIGTDFLREYGLLVNMKRGRLIDMTTLLQTKGTISNVVSLRPSFSPQQADTEYDALLAEFPAVTKPCLPPHPVKHSHSPHQHLRTTCSRPTSSIVARPSLCRQERV